MKWDFNFGSPPDGFSVFAANDSFYLKIRDIRSVIEARIHTKRWAISDEYVVEFFKHTSGTCYGRKCRCGYKTCGMSWLNYHRLPIRDLKSKMVELAEQTLWEPRNQLSAH